ncbi:hypothetical protein JCM8202_005618 [Rhodotorula sphaerocarpa]
MPGDAAGEAYPHTRALLHYLFAVYGRGKAGGSPPQPHAQPPNSSMALLEISVRKLALAQHRAASAASSSAPSDASATTDDEDDLDKNVSGGGALDDLAEEDKTRLVIGKLEDPSIDEDDMPDAIKETLNELLVIPPGENIDLDPLILALLHRHREDLHPSGNPVPPLPNHGSITPGSRPSLSRSSSSARGATMLGPGTARNADSRSPSRSPWSSPKPLSRTLNPHSSTFKFSVSASEFRPGGAGSGHVSPASPGTPGRTRSPMPISAQQAQQNWALNHSPLSTPRHSNAGSVTGTASAASSPGYFPRQLEQNVSQARIPRMPWADLSAADGDEQDEAGAEHARIDDAALPAETIAAFGGSGAGVSSPLYSPAIPTDQTYAHPQTASAMEAGQQWAEYPGGPQAGFFYPPHQMYPAPPAPGFAPPTEYGTYQGGPMYDPTAAAYGGAEAYGGAGDEYEPRGPGPAFITLPGPAPGEMPSIDFANQLSGSSGLGSIGAYAMTPFDHLHSIFGDSDISAEVLEEALTRSGFDVDQAIEYVIDTQLGNVPPPQPMMPADIPPGMMPVPQPRGFGASGSRPLIISRDSFDGFSGGNGGRGANSWGGRSATPTGDSRGVGGRVCRFYLAGNCLRSDCKFSHDVSKAVCKFWLRGHCLKGDGRCDFLHSIPPVLRADYEARTRMRQEAMYSVPPEPIPDEGPELDFPTLGDAPRSRRPMGGRGTVQLDPTRTRFAGAVKYGQKVTTPLPSRLEATNTAAKDAAPTPKRSSRINLRPPALLPTLPTGQALAALYIRYRQNFLELGANRNKCLAKAAECFKRGDGAGARKWSREAQDWSRQVAIEGRDSAVKIVEERKRILKDAIDANEGRGGSTDDAPDRKVRGRERGGGICLGVVSQGMTSDSRPLTEEERTEIALDLHALHTDEAIGFMGDFLLQLEGQKFQGLAFVVIGQQKHSGSSAPDKGEAAGRLRLERATTEFLSDQGWAWRNFDGILAVDCLR